MIDLQLRSLSIRICLLLAVAGAVLPAAAQNANCTATVTTTADTGQGSLRQTVAAVSAAAGSGTICVTATGTINLGSTLSIPQGITIIGPPASSAGANTLTISGQGQFQDIFLALNEATQESGTVSISLVNITNSVGRGVIVHQGVSAYLGSVTVENNADGGIDNGGTLTLVASNVLENTSKSNGGGIYNEVGGNLTLTDCSVSENNAGSFYGGGLENEAVATITDTLFELNTAAQGGAIENGSNAVDSGTILTISGGTQFLNNTVVGSGGGGAVANEVSQASEGGNNVTIAGSTFSGNTTRSSATGATTSGGAVYNGDQMTVSESTFDGNTADGVGGAIFNVGALGLIQDTVTGNTSSVAGSGISEGTSDSGIPASLNLNNTIVAGNTTDDCQNCGTPGAGNLVGGTPMLGPLSYNDTTGLTTVMPLPGSPAIGGGVYATGADPTDERGLSRITINGNSVSIDIGAVQTHYNSVAFVQGPTSGTATQTIAPPVTVQVKEVDGNTINYPRGVPVYLVLQSQDSAGTPTLSGTIPESPQDNGTSTVASFGDLSINVAGSFFLNSTTYPGDPNGYSDAFGATSGSFTMSPPSSPPTVSWSPASFVYGPLPASELNATVTLNGTTAACTSCSYLFTASQAPIVAGNVYSAGSYPVEVIYTSATGATYTASSTLLINQATPSMSLVTPPTLLPGAMLSPANVHPVVAGVGGATVAGTFAYFPELGSALTTGTQVAVTFTPTGTDATNYTTASASTTIGNVLSPFATTTTLTASPNPALPGATVLLSATVAPATGATGTVAGQVAFTPGPSTGNLALEGAAASFQPAAGATATSSPAGKPIVYTADFNGDGVADMLELVPAATIKASLTLLLGQPPSGAYGAPLAIALDANCSTISNVAIGDLNGDFLPDLVASCATGELISFEVLLNQGNGSFAAPIRITNPRGAFIPGELVGVGDFNADGKLDVVVIGARCSGNSGNACLVFEPGDGTGHFTAASYTPSDSTAATTGSAPVVADFDGDGLQDLAFVAATGSLQVWRNNGGAAVTFGTSCGDNCFNPSATIADANENAFQGAPVAASFHGGRPDLAAIAAGSGVEALSIALNASTSGTISFPATTTDTTVSGATALAAGDFDHDGHLDLAIYATGANTISVFEGDGTGAFALKDAGLSQTVLPGASFAAADANGDGIPDLIVLAIPAGAVDYKAQNFITSGASLATTPITAPAVTTAYTATTTPSVPYWAGSNGPTTLTAEAVPTQTTLTIGGLPTTGPPIYGTPLTLTAVVTNVGTVTPATGGSVTFTDNGVAIVSTLNPVSINSSGTASLVVNPTAGSHLYDAIYNGTTGEATSTSPTSTITVAKFTPTVIWANPAAINTTTPLSATQLNATLQGLPGSTLALPGTPVYTPTAGATLPAGTDTLSVVYTPTDTNDYNVVSKSVTIVVNDTNTRTTFTITPASLTATYTYGQALTLTASVVNTTGSTVVQGGTVTFSSDTGTLSSVTVVNGVATLSGVVLTGGTHLIGAAYTGGSGEGTSAAASQTITITKATPTLTWATPAPITTSTPLTGLQLNASAAGITGASLAGTPTYSPAPGSTLPFGTQRLSVSFAPSDTTDYTTATATVSIQVVASPTQTAIAVSPKISTYGQALTLTATVTNNGETAPVQTGTVTFSQNGVTLSTVPVSGGIATLSGVTLAAGGPVLKANYNGTSGENPSLATVTATINKATPTLTWPTPATISSTTPLSAEQLDATAAGANGTALPGAFVYTPASGTLTVGTHTLSVAFTPTDTNDYLSATATVSINVIATNTVTTFAVSPAAPVYGQPLTLTALVNNTTGTTVIQTGSVVFTSDTVTLGTVGVVNGSASLSGVSLTAGPHLITASYTGAAGEGTSAAAAQSITVARATPVVTWATPAQITTTTPLSATQLNATAAGVTGAALPGVFAYTPGAGATLTKGTHTLSATFTPTDATNYTTATATVTITVVPETISLASISPATTTVAATPLTVTLTGSGFPSSTVVLLNSTTTLATTVVSTTQLSATIPAANLSKAGALVLTLYDKASGATSNPVNLSVTAPTASATVTLPPAVTSGDQPALGITLAAPYPVDIAGTYTLTFTPSGPNGVDDPAVKFTNGATTLGFTISAGTTTAGAASLQTGTVEGTIAINTQLTAGGVDVTPPSITSGSNLTIAPAVPVITGVTFTAGSGASLTGSGGVSLTDTNGLLTITVTGYSNTREMTQASFTFTGPGAGDLSSPQVLVPATDLFGTWYANADSAAYGSTFSYTQTFQLSDPTTNITGVAVTLSNTAGTSASVNSQ